MTSSTNVLTLSDVRTVEYLDWNNEELWPCYWRGLSAARWPVRPLVVFTRRAGGKDAGLFGVPGRGVLNAASRMRIPRLQDNHTASFVREAPTLADVTQKNSGRKESGRYQRRCSARGANEAQGDYGTKRYITSVQ